MKDTQNDVVKQQDNTPEPKTLIYIVLGIALIGIVIAVLIWLGLWALGGIFISNKVVDFFGMEPTLKSKIIGGVIGCICSVLVPLWLFRAGERYTPGQSNYTADDEEVSPFR